ncbi:MAG: hypothetical protein ABH879_00640 [archaeon]
METTNLNSILGSADILRTDFGLSESALPVSASSIDEDYRHLKELTERVVLLGGEIRSRLRGRRSMAYGCYLRARDATASWLRGKSRHTDQELLELQLEMVRDLNQFSKMQLGSSEQHLEKLVTYNRSLIKNLAGCVEELQRADQEAEYSAGGSAGDPVALINMLDVALDRERDWSDAGHLVRLSLERIAICRATLPLGIVMEELMRKSYQILGLVYERSASLESFAENSLMAYKHISTNAEAAQLVAGANESLVEHGFMLYRDLEKGMGELRQLIDRDLSTRFHETSAVLARAAAQIENAFGARYGPPGRHQYRTTPG